LIADQRLGVERDEARMRARMESEDESERKERE